MRIYNRKGKRFDVRLVPANPENVRKALPWEDLKEFVTEMRDDTLIPLPEEKIILLSRTPGAGKNTLMAFEIFPTPSRPSLYGKGKRPVVAKSFPQGTTGHCLVGSKETYDDENN